MPVRYCAAPCPTVKAPSRRCWWLCFGSCARRPGRVGSRPRGSPQWRASGATDADAIRHQVGARSSQMDQGTRRHAGYAATAVRPDGSRNPRSCVVPTQKSSRRMSQPRTLIAVAPRGKGRTRSTSGRGLTFYPANMLIACWSVCPDGIAIMVPHITAGGGAWTPVAEITR